MKIYLVPLNESELIHLLRIRAEQSSQQVVEDPADADLVLFAGSFGTQPDLLLKHPLYSRYIDRCAVYTEDDNYLPLAPGVYCSARVDQHSRAGRTFSYSYLSRSGQFSNPFVGPAKPAAERSLLFSFQGGSTSLLRKRLFNLKYNREDVVIENTSTYYHWDLDQPGRALRQQSYAETIASSHFVLCPRGAGTGSIRLFEVMSAGIAPVLIADDYLLPDGPAWAEFLIRIPEKDIARLDTLLAPHAASSSDRGRLAQQAWQEHFSPSREFDAISELCRAALHHGPPAEITFRKQQTRIIRRANLRRNIRAMTRSAVLRALRMLRIRLPYQMNR